MGVVASSSVCPWANSCIAPGKAHLLVAVLVLAGALTFRGASDSWMVARDGVLAELALVLPTNPVMGELP